MLKSIHLKNFQKHKDLTINFEEGVDCLTGRSDVGKSAVLRAIRWVATNKPSGDAIIRHGAKSVEATIVTDKHTVRRVKNSKRNGYDLDGEEENAIGQAVPECVTKALNLQDINFQAQHDQPFLLSETAGEVGKMLNQLVDLSIIDTTLTRLNSRIKDVNKTVKVMEATEKEQKEEADKYKNVEKAHKILQTLIQQEHMYKLNLKKSLEMEETLIAFKSKLKETEGLDTINEALSEMSSIIECEKACEVSQKDIETFQTFIDKTMKIVSQTSDLQETKDALEWLSTLESLGEAIEGKNRDIEALSRITTLTERASNESGGIQVLLDALEGLEKLEMRQNRSEKRKERTEELEKVICQYRNRMEEVVTQKINIKHKEAEYKDLIGDECPLCGHSMDS